MNRTLSQILQLVLGVVIGVLITLVAVRYRDSQRINRISRTDWGKLNLILDIVDRHYVDTLDKNSMTDAAVSAALAKLDPHSVYLPPVQLSASEEELSGNFDGIGIQFNVPNDTAVVLEVIAGGPAEEVGMMIGDRLLKVDDKVIAGVNFPQDSMVRHIKGPSGTKVTVTVKRGGEEIPFEITRGKIPLHSMDAAFMLRDSVGYIRLGKFSRTTFKECHEAAMDLMGQGSGAAAVQRFPIVRRHHRVHRRPAQAARGLQGRWKGFVPDHGPYRAHQREFGIGQRDFRRGHPGQRPGYGGGTPLLR